MKTIGMIGGLAWPSTVTFYRTINEEIARRLGDEGSHSADLVLSQVDFHEVERCQARGDWDRVAELIGRQAAALKAAGADFYFIACNTVHTVFDRITGYTDLPCLHIVDPVGSYAVQKGLSVVGLMGSRYTMDGDYFTGRLQDKYGLRVLVPSESVREKIDCALYGELTRGIVSEETREVFRQCVAELADAGAQLIILGCTEYGLAVDPEESPVPVIDTAVALAKAAVNYALAE